MASNGVSIQEASEDLWQLVLLRVGTYTRRIYRYKRQFELKKEDWQDLLKLLRGNGAKLLSDDERRKLPLVLDIRSNISSRHGPQQAKKDTGRPFALFVDFLHVSRYQSTITLNIQYIDMKHQQNVSESNMLPAQYTNGWTIDLRLNASTNSSAISLDAFASTLPSILDDFWRGFSHSLVQQGFNEWLASLKLDSKLKIRKFDALTAVGKDSHTSLTKTLSTLYLTQDEIAPSTSTEIKKSNSYVDGRSETPSAKPVNNAVLKSSNSNIGTDGNRYSMLLS